MKINSCLILPLIISVTACRAAQLAPNTAQPIPFNELPELVIENIGHLLTDDHSLAQLAMTCHSIRNVLHHELDKRKQAAALLIYWKKPVKQMFNVDLWPTRGIYEIDDDQQGLAFSPAGTLIACAEKNGFSLWDAVTGKKVSASLGADGRGCHSLSFLKSDPPKLHVVEITDEDICTWQFTKKENEEMYDATVIDRLEIPYPDHYVAAFSCDRTIAVGCNDGKVRIWTQDGNYKELKPDDHRSSIISALTFSGDGKLMAIGTERGSVYVWNWQTNEKTKMPPLNCYETHALVSSVIFSFNQQYVTASYIARDNRMPGGYIVWDISTNTPVVNYAPPNVTFIAFSPDDKIMAAGEQDGAISLENIVGKRSVNDLPSRFHYNGAKYPVFSPDGTCIAARNDCGFLELWRTEDCSSTPGTKASAAPIACYCPPIHR